MQRPVCGPGAAKQAFAPLQAASRGATPCPFSARWSPPRRRIRRRAVGTLSSAAHRPGPNICRGQQPGKGWIVEDGLVKKPGDLWTREILDLSSRPPAKVAFHPHRQADQKRRDRPFFVSLNSARRSESTHFCETNPIISVERGCETRLGSPLSQAMSRAVLSAPLMNSLSALRHWISPCVKRPCLSAFWLPCGAPDPSASPCIRQRFLPWTAGDSQGLPDRVLAPQRGLSSMARM
jgi:hypothetical protein